jgi:hypothetical protein
MANRIQTLLDGPLMVPFLYYSRQSKVITLVEVNISLNDQNINIFTGIGWKFRLLVS